MWERAEESDENTEVKWKNLESGETVCVKRYETGTWDTFYNGKLIANRDNAEEAIERGREILET